MSRQMFEIRWLWLAGVLALIAVLARPQVVQAAGPGESGEPDVMCSGRVLARNGHMCTAIGPAAEALEQVDTELDPLPLPTTSVDLSLFQLPFRYIRLSSEDPTRLYGSAQDARDGNNSVNAIEAGFDYVSWLECQILDGKAVYMVAPGIWMRGGGDCSQIGTSDFRGVSLYRTPQRPFGWILSTVDARSQPGEGALSGTRYYRYQVVWIYEEQEVGGLTWYRISPTDWVEQRLMSVVRPDGTRPEGVESDRWISIDLYEQTVSAYEDGELVYATIASTGLQGWWTQPGTFQVYAKLDVDTMQGAFEADRSDYYYLQDVPWVLYYDQARAIHGAYWHNGYGYPRSHGCVNLSPVDANWFYRWAEEGTYVHVYDPTGQTPTDEEFFGSGGA
ncbi:MAG TPA: L,D-transpeptidase [Anaerolineales bacterium]